MDIMLVKFNFGVFLCFHLMIAKHHLNFDWPEILKLALDIMLIT